MLWQKSFSDATSELFVFCDNMPRDVVAGLLFWGVKFSKKTSLGSCTDGGTLFSFSMFWTAEDAFPRVLCRACCPFIHVVNNLCCLVRNMRPYSPLYGWINLMLR